MSELLIFLSKSLSRSFLDKKRAICSEIKWTNFQPCIFAQSPWWLGLISKHLKGKFWIWGPLQIWHNLPRDPNFVLNKSLHPCEGTGQPHYTLPDPTFKHVQSTTAISTAVTIYLYLLYYEFTCLHIFFSIDTHAPPHIGLVSSCIHIPHLDPGHGSTQQHPSPTVRYSLHLPVSPCMTKLHPSPSRHHTDSILEPHLDTQHLWEPHLWKNTVFGNPIFGKTLSLGTPSLEKHYLWEPHLRKNTIFGNPIFLRIMMQTITLHVSQSMRKIINEKAI